VKNRGQRILSILLLISLFVGLAAACKSPSPTNTPGVDTPGVDTPTAITPEATGTAVPTVEPTVTPGPTPTPLPPINPIIIERRPARGEEAAVDGAIEISFDQPMDRDSVEAALNVSAGGDVPLTIAGSIEWPDEATLRFIPVEPLERAAQYAVTVGTEATSKRGLALQREVAFSFATVGFLAVSQVIPAPDTADVASDASITVMFNRPVVPLVAVSDPARNDLPHPLSLVRASDGAQVEGSGEWLNTSI
jgi:hypothetical protein